MPRSRRDRELALIHIGKKQLCDDDEAYRDMLETVAGGALRRRPGRGREG